MKEYKVINHYRLSDFQSDVQESLDQGWELHGHLNVHLRGDGSTDYLQAMIREKPVDETSNIPQKDSEIVGGKIQINVETTTRIFEEITHSGWLEGLFRERRLVFKREPPDGCYYQAIVYEKADENDAGRLLAGPNHIVRIKFFRHQCGSEMRCIWFIECDFDVRNQAIIQSIYEIFKDDKKLWMGLEADEKPNSFKKELLKLGIFVK